MDDVVDHRVQGQVEPRCHLFVLLGVVEYNVEKLMQKDRLDVLLGPSLGPEVDLGGGELPVDF